MGFAETNTAPPDEGPFWLVADLSEPHPVSALKRFSTFAEARTQAERLARQHHGQRFYVLSTRMFVESGDLRTVEFQRAAELPL